MGDEITAIKQTAQNVGGWQEPPVLDLNWPEGVQQLRELRERGKIKFVSDQIAEAVEELFHIEYPSQIDSVDQQAYSDFVKRFGDLDAYGNWVFFPWSGSLVHFPTSEDLSRLRGSRNRNLITDDERKTLRDNKTIMILGLSVGSNVIDSLLMQGIGSKYILVDMDSLSPTNLNRIRASYDQVGVHKVDMVAKRISELDPYITQVHYKNGIDEQSFEEALAAHKPDIIVDEMDSLKMKLKIRLRAKELGLPVLMATDDGDDILLDIERFDLDSQQPILHGIMPQEVIDGILNGEKLSRQEMGAIIGKYFVNLQNVPLRMLESLLEVGRSLPSWPQLGSAAVLSGLYVAYAAKKILLGQNLNSGRFLMGPEEQLNPDIKSQEYQDKKNQIIQRMSGAPN